MIKYTYFFMMILFVSFTSIAQPAHAESAEDFITTLGEDVLKIAAKKQLNHSQKETELANMFKRNIDFKWIGGFVLGKHKRTASPEQLTRYDAAYEKFIIKSYGSRFKDYAGETFKIISSSSEGADKTIVKTEIVRPTESNVLVDYKVKKSGNSYKVYDLIVEGISLITTQRSEFNSVITRKDLNTLIKALEKKA